MSPYVLILTGQVQTVAVEKKKSTPCDVWANIVSASWNSLKLFTQL